MTKIDIYSGFLGAGKTTLIRKMLKEGYETKKLVLIENDFGQIGIDGGFLQETGIEIREMNSGCICCSLVGDFSKALEQVIAEYAPDRVIIEPSGVGKLSDVIAAVQKVTGSDVELGYTVTVADANKCKVYMRNFGEFYNNQVETASTIILSRTGDIPQAKLDAAVALLRERNDKATIVTTPWDQLTGAQLVEAMEQQNTLALELADLKAYVHEHHHEEECGCGHEHHHHDEECGCGHEHHHHDEKCGCGHEHHHHDEECGCGHEHHHHDEKCGCGHEHHHHDEECGCGHEHHHHDEKCGCGHEHHHHEEGCTCGHEHHHHDEECGCGHEHHHHDEGCTCGHDHHHHHHADEVFSSWGVETAKKYTKDQITNILEELEGGEMGTVLRAKGIVPAEDGTWIHFDYVPGEMDLRSGAAAVTGRLCVIGAKLDEKAIAALFGV